MDEQMKGFWKYFIFLVAGAAVNFAGALIGKTVLGYILYGVGLAAVIAVALLVFLKKSYFKGNHLRVLIFAVVLGLLLAGGAALLLGGSTGSAAMQAPAGFTGSQSSGNTRGSFSGQMPSAGQVPSGGTTSGGQSSGGQMPTWGGNTSGSTGSSTGNFPTAGNIRSSSSSKGTTSLIGWIVLGLGAALLIFIVVLLITKKTSIKGDRWKIALLGFVVSALIASAAVLMFVGSSSASFPQGVTPPQMGQQTTGQQTAAATESATEVPTATATPAPTKTQAPTATATLETYSSLVVCLNYDVQVGANIRNFPSETGKNVGMISMASCFTIDGRSSQYEGWYHLASGQNGMGGVQIWGDETSGNLWVNGDNFLISKDKLDKLADIQVSAAATTTPGAATATPTSK